MTSGFSVFLCFVSLYETPLVLDLVAALLKPIKFELAQNQSEIFRHHLAFNIRSKRTTGLPLYAFM